MTNENPAPGSTAARAGRWIGRLEIAIPSILLMLVMLLIIVEIVLRNLGIQGFHWLEEVSRNTLVIATLLGSSLAVRSGGHMVMDTLYEVVSPRARHALRTVVALICAVFFLYIGGYAAYWTIQLTQIGKTMETLQAPAYIMWIFVSFAFVSMGVRYTMEFVKGLLHRETTAASASEF